MATLNNQRVHPLIWLGYVFLLLGWYIWLVYVWYWSCTMGLWLRLSSKPHFGWSTPRLSSSSPSIIIAALPLYGSIINLPGLYWLYIYMICVYIYIYGWWYTYPSEKYARQLGWLFPIYGKHVPNHQLDMYNIQCHFVGYLPNTYFRQLCKVRLTCLLMKPTCLLVQPPL